MPGRGLFVGTGALVVAAVAGCAEPASPSTPAAERGLLPPGVTLAEPAVREYSGPPPGHGAMSGVRATRMASALAAAGLDPANLPPLEALDPRAKQRVMRTFSESLGLPCTGCHDEHSFRADTRRKRFARRMWNEIVRVVAMADGQPAYCDSCHDGALYRLDRSASAEVARYMDVAMVRRLRRTDGRPHDCTTCHGDPPELHLVEAWKAEPSPVIVTQGTLEVGDRVRRPVWPAEGVVLPAIAG